MCVFLYVRQTGKRVQGAELQSWGIYRHKAIAPPSVWGCFLFLGIWSGGAGSGAGWFCFGGLGVKEGDDTWGLGMGWDG